jgi:2-haloalkanoic acid dehalogenase type II
MPRLSDFKVLTFDCYGTLIDWETGIWDAFQPLLMANDCATIQRQAALEAFANLENAQESATPSMIYGDVLRHVHAQFAEQFDLRTNDELDAAFGDALALWPAFPDTADALRYLKTKYKLVILSNVSRAGFAASNRKLGVTFDAIYTAEDIGSYKPSAANFDYLLEHLASDFGLQKNDILHTAQSLFHDHVPAKQFGLANAWIDRQRLSESGQWGATAKIDTRPDTDFLFFSMGEMAEAVARETNDE